MLILITHAHTSEMAQCSSSPCGGSPVRVRVMDRPKSLRTQLKSPRTRIFLLLMSLWHTAGLYNSETMVTTVTSMTHHPNNKTSKHTVPTKSL